ncbi:MAG TPA: DUF4337 family protein, partial [Gemmataceae bacterium]|nr:DUF4337 family protein [Gemmataceae bacterium]
MSGTPPAEGKPRKSLWDTILTATPVVLTVLATLLAGMSSSEMTQAQYHRSLAAQNQSKAGDQWGLFQAKRIRGTNLEMTVELLRNTSNPGPVSPDDVKRAAAQLAGALARGDRQAKELQKAVAAGGGSGAAVKRAADDLAAAAPKLAGRARKLQQDADAALAKMTSADAFAYLSAGRLPAVEDTPVEDERINEALRAIAERKTEHQNEPLLRRISDADVEKALDVALANERAFDRATGPATEAQAVLDRVLKEEAALARDFQDRVEEVQAALADAPAGADSAAARTAAANLERTANAAARAAGRA